MRYAGARLFAVLLFLAQWVRSRAGRTRTGSSPVGWAGWCHRAAPPFVLGAMHRETADKGTFRRIAQAVNAHDEAALFDVFEEVFVPDVLIHNPLPTSATGVEAMKEVFAELCRGFPDLHIRIDDLLQDENKVVARQTVEGTNLGEFMGLPPTGRSVTYSEIFIFRLVDGKVVEIWGVVDLLSQQRQLGLI
jgi:steroid delta-isomerase-like uncharacterized protein